MPASFSNEMIQCVGNVESGHCRTDFIVSGCYFYFFHHLRILFVISFCCQLYPVNYDNVQRDKNFNVSWGWTIFPWIKGDIIHWWIMSWGDNFSKHVPLRHVQSRKFLCMVSEQDHHSYHWQGWPDSGSGDQHTLWGQAVTHGYPLYHAWWSPSLLLREWQLTGSTLKRSQSLTSAHSNLLFKTDWRLKHAAWASHNSQACGNQWACESHTVEVCLLSSSRSSRLAAGRE